MFERGEKLPNWHLTDVSGESHDLWNYRQKSHLLLLYDPEASKETQGRWQKAVQADQKQWDWLNTKVIVLSKAPEEVAPGAYVVDRYGIFWTYFSPGKWTFDDLERDLVYYEARHC